MGVPIEIDVSFPEKTNQIRRQAYRNPERNR